MNSETTLPAITRRARKPALSTEPPKRFHRDLSSGVQLDFSKEKMLLLDLLSPDYYSVRLTQTNELPITITISADIDSLTISPKELQFTEEGQEVEVRVYASEEVREVVRCGGCEGMRVIVGMRGGAEANYKVVVKRVVPVV